MKEWFGREVQETKVLFRCIPIVPVIIFIVSVIAMNLMASKLIVNTSWLSLDAGIVVSWISFLTMDMLVKRFGPRAAIKVNLLAVFVNIIVMLLFTAAAFIPGDWALNDYSTGINWWIIGASTAAFIVSGVVNSILAWAIRKMFKKNQNGVACYITSSYISTMVGQFVDNLVFAFIFTFWFGGLTVLAMFMFAVTGAVVELICEIIFSPIGYRVSENWRKQDIGKEYIELVQFNKESL